MNCPHFKDGRCSLAESLAAAEIGRELECRPTANRCDLCLKAGAATVDNPGTAVLGMVGAQAGGDKKWRAFVAFKMQGKSRGLGDTIAKVTRATGIAKATTAVAKAFGVDCGCGGRQKKANEILPY